jgi:hypothetical protein
VSSLDIPNSWLKISLTLDSPFIFKKAEDPARDE